MAQALITLICTFLGIKIYSPGFAIAIIPDCIKNSKIVDLGCGTGRDVYLLSQFVGENGQVVGIDMTDEQIEKAESFKDYHTKKFNYTNSNIQFKKGYIEFLEEIGLKNNT